MSKLCNYYLIQGIQKSFCKTYPLGFCRASLKGLLHHQYIISPPNQFQTWRIVSRLFIIKLKLCNETQIKQTMDVCWCILTYYCSFATSMHSSSYFLTHHCILAHCLCHWIVHAKTHPWGCVCHFNVLSCYATVIKAAVTVVTAYQRVA